MRKINAIILSGKGLPLPTRFSSSLSRTHRNLSRNPSLHPSPPQRKAQRPPPRSDVVRLRPLLSEQQLGLLIR